MTVVEATLARIPQPYRDKAIKHRELIKFLMVGGSTWVIDTVVFLVLKATVLADKPVTAKVIAVLVATMVSYVLNREWSFRTRGGRERHHEALLFFVISGFLITSLLLREIAATDEMKQRMREVSADVPLQTPEEIAAFMKNASTIGAGPLMVMDTDVFGSQRSNPEYSFFASSTVQIATPALPILP